MPPLDAPRRPAAIMDCPTTKFYNYPGAMQQRSSQPAARRLFRYSLVAGSLLGATVATLYLRTLVPMCDFLFFIVAVTISAWYAGMLYGICAALVSVLLIDYFLDEPAFRFDLDQSDLVRLSLFLIAALVITSLSALQRNRIERLERANRDLRLQLDRAPALDRMLPICSTCRQLRDNAGEWMPIEDYLRAHAQVQFTHGLCPDCINRDFPAEL